MKFTRREQLLLTFLGIFLAIVAYYNFFLSVQLKDIDSLKSDIVQYSDAINTNNLYKQKVAGMDKELKALNEKMQHLRSIFPPIVNYDELLVNVKGIAQDSGLDINSINFSEPSEVISEGTGNDGKKNPASSNGNSAAKDKTGNNGGVKVTDSKLLEAAASLGFQSLDEALNGKMEEVSSKVEDGTGYVINIDMSVKGTYAELKGFLKLMGELRCKTVVKNIQIVKADGEELSVKMVVGFLGIMDRSAGVYTMLPTGLWEPLPSAEKDDIFKDYDGYNAPQFAVAANAQDQVTRTFDIKKVLEELKSYDFIMRVRPYSNGMALPTVSISGEKVAAGNSRMPMIFGDNKAVENVEIYVEQDKGGKYLCKFKTQSEAYPDKAYSKLAELNPAGEELSMLVESMARKFKDDASGVTLNIFNKTKKNFKVVIKNEDQSKPRVSVEKKEGSITVEFK